MEENPTRSRVKLTKLGWSWFGALVASAALGWILGWFDHSTELTPDHLAPLKFGFVAACTMAVLSAVVIFSQSKGRISGRLVMSLVVAPIFSILGVVLSINEIAALVENHNDFPTGKTRTFQGLLLIDRAYQTHGRGRSWNIQTTPIWSNLDITQADYEFMRTHRRPGDLSTDPDEIPSKGYFCAKVTLQQADEALRVLNAGTYKLPLGTIGICSLLRTEQPTLPVLQ